MFHCSSCSKEDVESGTSSQCVACGQSSCLECLDADEVCVPCDDPLNF